jgi:hypothetical protein
MAFSMAAEIERDLISQRTKEALRFKKAQGMKLGRPTGPGKSKLDPYRPEIESLLANGSTQKFIARRYLTTEANLHNWLKKHGLSVSVLPTARFPATRYFRAAQALGVSSATRLNAKSAKPGSTEPR